MTKTVSKLGEEGKVAIRNVRRDAMKAIEKLEKDGSISGGCCSCCCCCCCRCRRRRCCRCRCGLCCCSTFMIRFDQGGLGGMLQTMEQVERDGSIWYSAYVGVLAPLCVCWPRCACAQPSSRPAEDQRKDWRARCSISLFAVACVCLPFICPCAEGQH